FVSEVPLLEKEFTNDPVAPGNSVDLEFTITNSSSVNPMTEISFTDELTTFLGFPVSVTLPGSVCNGGSLSLVSCGSDCQTLSFSGGSLAAGAICSFTVTIDIPAGQPGGIFTNTSSEVTALVNGLQVIGSPASDDLVILNAPSISKEFTDDPVMPGDIVHLDFHIHYSANALSDATDISFTDDLNATLAGLILASVDMNTCGGTVGGVSTSSLNFSGGTLSADEDCLISITLSVPANAAFGFHGNTSSNVTATVSGQNVTGNQATDDLLVSPVLFTKEFLDGPFLPGETATLRFSIENLSSQSLTNMIFTDNLDQVLNGLVAVGLPANDICGQGSQISGSTNLIFTGGNLLSGTSCSFDVTVSIPANAGDGEYLNTTSNLSLTHNNSNFSFPPASDILEIKSDYLELTKEFIDDPINPGDQVTLEFTITNLHPTDQISSISFSDDLNAALSGLAATGLPLNNFCGQGSSLTGTSNLSLTGGSLGPGASCTFAVDLSVPASATPGTQNTNTTSTITGIVGDFPANGPFASDNLTIAIIIDNCSQDVLVVDNPLLDLTAQTATFHAIQLLQSNGTIVPGRDISYKSGGSAVLFPNFEVQQGASFAIDIEACPE
ncbi:MAG: hypothetical protein OEM26_15980, partial [Saprospiraceae bacterium]|nr:hypothetical protein [Saprospiraceae bacterium]